MNRRDALLPLSLLAGAALVSGCAVAQEPWPNLNEAEGHLRLALDALNRAPDRFGGHKAESRAQILRAEQHQPGDGGNQ